MSFLCLATLKEKSIKRNNITFRNRNGEKFSRENDVFDNLVADEEEKKVYPDIPAEIPGIPLEEGINSGAQASDFQEETSLLRNLIAKAAANRNPSEANKKDR